MNMPNNRSIPWIAALLFLLSCGTAWSAEVGGQPAGRIIAAVGAVTAERADGTSRPLRRRSEVYAGDILVTGPKATAQVRFTDNGLLQIQPNSRFQINEYRFSGKEDGSESAVFKLLKGGMRSITGAIGHTNKENYKVDTPVATIGLRGTDWGAYFCEGGACRDGRGRPLADGLYCGVASGGVRATNRGGQGEYGKDAYFYVADQNTKPVPLTAPPGVVFGSSGDGGGTGDDTTGAPAGDSTGSSTFSTSTSTASAAGTSSAGASTGLSTGFTSTSSQSLLNPTGSSGSSLFGGTVLGVINLSSQQTLTSGDVNVGTSETNTDPFAVNQPAGSAAPSGAATVVATTIDRSLLGDPSYEPENRGIVQGANMTDSFNTDTVNSVANVVVRAQFTDTGTGATCTPCVFQINQATLAEHDGIIGFAGTGTAINWGRWNGSAIISEGGSNVNSVDQHHYIYSSDATAAGAIPTSGTATFQYVGGPSPSDETGALGVMNSGQVAVDFGNMAVTSAAYQMTFYSGTANQRVYTAGLTGTVPFSEAFDPNQGMPLGGTCTGGACGTAKILTGSSNMIFVGPAAEGILSGVSVQTTDGLQSATGVGVLQQTTTIVGQ
jgi:hypothetical protein